MPKVRTILCIDDEPMAVELRCKFLERAGFRVIVAATPAEGIRLFHAQPIDLVVLDYWMPDVKGIEVAQRLRNAKRKVPIIMLSGFRPIADEGIGSVDKWLIKGESDPQDLLDAVNELLNRKKKSS